MSEAAAARVTVPSYCPDSVYVAFFEHGTYTAAGSSVLSALSSARLRRISPKFEHCQLVFEWASQPSNVRVTFSTTKMTHSAFVRTGYRNRNWKAILVHPLRQEDRERLFRWVLDNEHAPFNECGYYWNFLPLAECFPCLAYDASGDSFFCAEQVAAAMRVARAHPIFAHARPYECTPDAVHEMLTAAGFQPLTLVMPFRPRRREIGKFSLRHEAGAWNVATAGMVNRTGDDTGQRDVVASAADEDDDDERGGREDGCCFVTLAALVGFFCWCSCCAGCASCDHRSESARAESLWRYSAAEDV